jgi:hypothetical protein
VAGSAARRVTTDSTRALRHATATHRHHNRRHTARHARHTLCTFRSQPTARRHRRRLLITRAHTRPERPAGRDAAGSPARRCLALASSSRADRAAQCAALHARTLCAPRLAHDTLSTIRSPPTRTRTTTRRRAVTQRALKPAATSHSFPARAPAAPQLAHHTSHATHCAPRFARGHRKTRTPRCAAALRSFQAAAASHSPPARAPTAPHRCCSPLVAATLARAARARSVGRRGRDGSTLDRRSTRRPAPPALNAAHLLRRASLRSHAPVAATARRPPAVESLRLALRRGDARARCLRPLGRPPRSQRLDPRPSLDAAAFASSAERGASLAPCFSAQSHARGRGGSTAARRQVAAARHSSQRHSRALLAPTRSIAAFAAARHSAAARRGSLRLLR